MTSVAALRALEDGFLGAGSIAPSQEVLARVISMGADLNGKQIVPSWTGGVQVEWTAGSCEYTAEVERDGNLFLCIDNTATDDLNEIVVPFDVTTLHVFLASGRWDV